MRKRPEPFLLVAERALDRLEEYVPATVDDFLGQRVLQDAILLPILQIGENLAQLRSRFPEEFNRAPEAWNQIIGLRNTIAHGYETIRVSEVWQYLTEELDDLRDSLSLAQSEGWFDSPCDEDHLESDLPNRST